ncbi:MAG: histidine kinase [Gemmatimonadota bacterium]
MACRVERLLRPLAGVPLFYKILVANSLIVLVGATVGTTITAEFVRSGPSQSTFELVAVFATLGTIASVVVNALILRVALRPIRRLEAAAAAVRSGDPSIQAEVSAFSDRDFRRLVETFNDMLDRLRESRRRLRELASQATRAAEAERKRIACELHDDTAQRLAALKLRLKVVGEMDVPGERRALLEEVRAELTDALAHVRLTAHALRPETLEDLGFGPALRLHARRLEEQHEARISVEGPAT